MNRRVAGLVSALAAVGSGLAIVGCASTVDGEAVANQADVTSYRSSVASVSSSAAAATSSQAASRQNAVCAAFIAGALDAASKIDVVKKRADEHADRDTARAAITDAATSLNSAGSQVGDALAKNPTPASFSTTLSEYSKAATAFGGQMTKLGLGSSNNDDFMSTQDRYFTAKDAALTACS